MSKHVLCRWVIAFAAAAILVVASIFFFDHPLARFVARLDVYQTLSENKTVSQPWMVMAAAMAVTIGVVLGLFYRPLPRWAKAGLVAGAALLISVSIVAFILKPLFARALPSEFLASGYDRFFWPPAAIAGYAFPSGHTTQAAAILSVFWSYYPTWRWLYAAALLVLSCLLLLGEWHYLSDIIAGAFIGWTTGLVVMGLWRRLA